MDFYEIKERALKSGTTEVRPAWRVLRFKDLMIRGKSFYAVYNPETHFWSTEEYDLMRIVDADVARRFQEASERVDGSVWARYLGDYDSKTYSDYKAWMSKLPDVYHPLDGGILFADQTPRREDYATRTLTYSLSDDPCPAYEELMSALYDPDEREKLEWGIGAVFTGDSKWIQKFFVLYGSAGSGKSTVLNLISRLLDDHIGQFDAAALGRPGDQFALEPFKSNPRVAIQHDGNLARIADNSRLNSLVSHETMVMNEKGKSLYSFTSEAMLFVGTNLPVRITDSKSGLTRRLIDVEPSGRKLDIHRYNDIMDRIEGERGSIVKHCMDLYMSKGSSYYDDYKPIGMMSKTNPIFNFLDFYSDELDEEDGISLKRIYEMYKEYSRSYSDGYVYPMFRFKDEIRDYFEEFHDRIMIHGVSRRKVYKGLLKSKFSQGEKSESPIPDWTDMSERDSYLDELYKDRPAQYANENGLPSYRWDDVSTTLKDLDTRKEHYVLVPERDIVIDIDLDKDRTRCLEEARKWIPSYAELSRSGGGVHIHYRYPGDPSELSRMVAPGVECKVYSGKSALRRRLTECTDHQGLTEVEVGYLPVKEQSVIKQEVMQSEKSIRKLISRNLRKEIHPGTKPSIDFIKKILDDAYESGMPYDVSDIRQKVLTFAMKSTHQADYCIKLVQEMHFSSEHDHEEEFEEPTDDDTPIVFDVEVFPNLFLVNWKVRGSNEIQRMINPTPNEISDLAEKRLVGFNNRRYDNHILYGRMLGYSNEQLYHLSRKIINNLIKEGFKEAYNLSYTDIYDFAAKKQSLKKWEIELGIHHKELGLPWDQPVPEDQWEEVAAYCDNDVIATEKVWDHLEADWEARQILASIAGLPVNSSTNNLTTRIIFQGQRNTQQYLRYTDLSEIFPGYRYEYGKSTYRGEEVGEGGYVYAEPGYHENVALLDIASMHPTSIENLQLFGPYTKRYSELKRARILIKHKELDEARKILNGALAPYLDDESNLDALAYALKIALNSTYGLTAAKFDNPLRDPRNMDNIVAKRGALFMVDLKHFVQEKGYTVAHIKTDSIKIPNADDRIISEVFEFGRRYGYVFEHEATYDRMLLANDAVYIAHDKDGWHATGKQFQEPLVFKTIFSGDPLDLEDVAQTRSVTTRMFLEFGEDDRKFVGRVGSFLPVYPGTPGAGRLVRENHRTDKEGNELISYGDVSGCKGYRWLDYEDVQGDWRDVYDDRYGRQLVDAAMDQIRKWTDVDAFLAA
jgi:energy-coupling factor transporter ATP-binding protein EcfA2